MGKTIRWLVLVVVVLGVLGGAVYALRPTPVGVDVAAARLAPMVVTVDEEGRTRIKERFVISSPLAGRLGRVTLDPGDRVVADETVLAVVEPSDPELLDARALAEADARVSAAEAAVSQSEANAERALADAGLAEARLARVEEMFSRGASNDFEMLEARAGERSAAEAVRASEHAVTIARFELALARSALLFATGEDGSDSRGRLLIRSPITGVVLRVLQESAAVVSPGTPMLELGDLSKLEVVVDVLSTDGVRIRPGDRVIIEDWGGDDALSGIVRLVEPAAFTKVSALGIEEQRVNVIVDFEDGAATRPTLGDAYRVENRIVIWSATEVLQIPSSAAFRDNEGWAVFVVELSRARLRRIEIGRRSGDSVQILSGLDESETVVLHPSDKIAEGVRVAARSE